MNFTHVKLSKYSDDNRAAFVSKSDVITLTGSPCNIFVPVPTQDLDVQHYIVVTFVFNYSRWEVIVHFVDIGGIVDHCLTIFSQYLLTYCTDLRPYLVISIFILYRRIYQEFNVWQIIIQHTIVQEKNHRSKKHLWMPFTMVIIRQWIGYRAASQEPMNSSLIKSSILLH